MSARTMVIDADPPARIAQRDAPEPLRRPIPPAEPYPVEALGEVLGGAAHALHRVVQSPLALCGQSVLAAASVAAQRLADVGIDGRQHPLTLWFQTIAESGERKSATDGPALKAIRDAERKGFDNYALSKSVHEAEGKAYGAASKAAEAKAAKVSLADGKKLMVDLGSAPPPPLLPHLLCGEPTLEGLHKLLMNGVGALGLFSDEGAQFFGGHAMQRENAAKTAGGLSSLWDRGEADRVRSGDGAHKLYGKRLAMHMLMQPVIAERVLSDPLMQGQGFLARCLIAWPDGTAGSRPYAGENLDDNPAMLRYWSRLSEMLAQPPQLRQGSPNEFDPPVLRLSADAKRLWVRAHDAIEGRMLPDAEYSSIKPWASKAPEQILRIAGVLTITAHPNAAEIGADAIESAATLVSWHLAEVLRLLGVAEIPPSTRAAEAVLEWCRMRKADKVHSRMLVQFGPGCIRIADRMHAAMNVLERHGWADRLDAGTVIDGRPRRHAWHMNLED